MSKQILLPAVGYYRFSSDGQREESVEAQMRACQEFAARNNIEIVSEYIDRALSAKTDQRPEFQRMIKDSAAGNFNMVIVHKLDRFARNRYDSAHYKHLLKRNGVTLRSVIENIDGSPESVIMESVLEGMAEYYSLNLAREVMKGLKENALQGKFTGGKPALGYDVDRETMMFVINPHEAQAVRLIFSLYLDGKSYGEIIDELTGRGYTTKTGQQFGKNSLHDILRNPKYSGTYIFSRIPARDIDGRRNSHASKAEDQIIRVEGGVPALVSKDDFDRVQERMEQRKYKSAQHRAKRTYLLSGKVFCGECGTAYIGNCRTLRNGSYIYLSYRCNSRKRPPCNGWEIRAGILESIVLGELANIIFNEAMIPKLVDGYRQHLVEQNQEEIAMQEILSNKITSIQKDMDSIMDVIIKTSSDALVNKLNALDNQKQELIRKLHKARDECKLIGPSTDELSVSFKQAREMLKTGQLPTVKVLIERYIHKVIVSGDNIEIQFNLNISSRVVTYSADLSQKEIPQSSDQEITEVLAFVPTKMLATRGAGGRTRTGTPLRAVDFESTTSTNSITPAQRSNYST